MGNNNLNCTFSVLRTRKKIDTMFMEKQTGVNFEPKQHTQTPTVMGGSVVALKYKDGVVMACNDALYWHGTYEFEDAARFHQINENTIIAASGDYADFQFMTKKLDAMQLQNYMMNTGNTYHASNFASYLVHLANQKKGKGNPLWCENVIVSRSEGKNYIATVDMWGNLLENDYMASGMARYTSGDVIEKHWTPEATLEETIEVVKNVFKVLFCKWKCHSPNVSIRVINDQGVVADRTTLEFEWNHYLYHNKPRVIL